MVDGDILGLVECGDAGVEVGGNSFLQWYKMACGVFWRRPCLGMVWWLDTFGSLYRNDALIALMVGSSVCWVMGGSKQTLNVRER